jgi:hypothetical protein
MGRKGPVLIPTSNAGSNAERKKPWWIEDRREEKEREHGQEVSKHCLFQH